MTLLITLFAAIICTVIWYCKANNDKMMINVLCYMFWGASLMWLIDAIYEYVQLGAKFFSPDVNDLINDTYLGLSVVALALVIWLIILLIKDPKEVVKDALVRKKNKK